MEERNIREFADRGFTILRNALSLEELDALVEEADTLANYLMDEGFDLVNDLGCIVEPLTCGYLDAPENDRYKTDEDAYRERRDSILLHGNIRVSDILLSKVAEFAAQLLDTSNVYLLNEQYIIKPPRTAKTSRFAWHRDSDYLEQELQQKPTVACWIALDPVDESNGTILIQDAASSINVPANSIVFMSNRLVHKSAGNASNRFRRVFMPQYSAKPLTRNAAPVGLAVPCTCRAGAIAPTYPNVTTCEGEMIGRPECRTNTG
ncbi:hypothetical protein VTP01DRAFT_9225 [Rhizomucor pusillus]|uniref:uncharacterized protein n=1 Tax=Rhizomucor pusillus TaxID=4840 RepID=UPI003744AD21